MRELNFLAAFGTILLIIGGLNWGLVALFDFDLIAYAFGDMTPITRLLYGVVAMAALGVAAWLPIAACSCKTTDTGSGH